MAQYARICRQSHRLYDDDSPLARIELNSDDPSQKYDKKQFSVRADKILVPMFLHGNRVKGFFKFEDKASLRMPEMADSRKLAGKF